MSKFDDKKSMPRYRIIAWVMVLIAICVVSKAAYIMTAQRSYWLEVADRLKSDSVPVKPARGNILSAEGQLLASSLPEYTMHLDFVAMKESKADTLWDAKIDSISIGLSRIFPQWTAQQFREHLNKGREKQSRYWAVWPKRVSYSDFVEVQSLPIFRLPKYKSGFTFEENNARRRPYGSLASRTIGDMYAAADMDSARFGLEQYYDSTLRGKEGYINRRKVRSRYLDIMIKEPVDGADIVTTIDVNIQDLAERSLINELREINGELGVAIVMETRTGDVKAMVNMSRLTDGDGNVILNPQGLPIYREVKNNAVSDLVEPGSVFKTASMMVALEDGMCDTTKTIDCTGGVALMHGREMRDHNWRRGGYGRLSMPWILYYSSNIGVSKIIDEYYRSNPQKFVDGLHRLGFGMDFELPFRGAQPHAKVLGPEARKQIRGGYWSKTTLPWMSIGYETQVPPIFTVAFYNAIANGGRLMQPRFVTRIEKGGEVLKEFPPVCLKEHIASDRTLNKISNILEGVVSKGLGSKAGSKLFKVAGKTGTAQIAGAGGYKNGAVRYWLSFCGFFPYENPQYTCIVCIKKTGMPASGGGMCGKVFHEISEGIMAKSLKHEVSVAKDSLSIPIPDVKDGNLLAADYVLSCLGIKTAGGWDGSYTTGNPVWGSVRKEKNSVSMEKKAKVAAGLMPDVHGMGARDAVFLLENRGMKVQIKGCGKVKKQSVAPQSKIKKGMHVMLELS